MKNVLSLNFSRVRQKSGEGRGVTEKVNSVALLISATAICKTTWGIKTVTKFETRTSTWGTENCYKHNSLRHKPRDHHTTLTAERRVSPSHVHCMQTHSINCISSVTCEIMHSYNALFISSVKQSAHVEQK